MGSSDSPPGIFNEEQMVYDARLRRSNELAQSGSGSFGSGTDGGSHGSGSYMVVRAAWVDSGSGSFGVDLAALVVWSYGGSGSGSGGSGSGSGGYGDEAIISTAIYLNGSPAGDGDALAEGDVISVHGAILVEHDGSFESCRFDLSGDNNFYDSPVLVGHIAV